MNFIFEVLLPNISIMIQCSCYIPLSKETITFTLCNGTYKCIELRLHFI